MAIYFTFHLTISFDDGSQWTMSEARDVTTSLTHCSYVWNFVNWTLSEILIEIHTFSLKKIRLKMSSAKCRPFCLGLNILSHPSGMRSICCVCCGDLHNLPLWKLQRWWSWARLWCTQAPKGISPLAYNEENHQLQSPNFSDNRPVFIIEISHPNNFFFGKLLFSLWSHCKNISWFSWRYYGSHFYGRM